MITPNYFRCESTKVIGVTSRGEPAAARCGFEYHEGRGTGELCSCGMFAVGRCTTCARPMCGDHRYRSGNSSTWRCGPCLAEERERRRKADEEEEAGVVRAHSLLPHISRDLLKAWIVGDVPREAFEHGVTHRADELTNRDVADLLSELLLDKDYTYIVSGSGISPTEPPGSSGMKTIQRGVTTALPRSYNMEHGYSTGAVSGDVTLGPQGIMRRSYYYAGNGDEYHNGAGVRQETTAYPDSLFAPGPWSRGLTQIRSAFADNVLNLARKKAAIAGMHHPPLKRPSSASDCAFKFGCLLVIAVMLVAIIVASFFFK